MTWEDIDLQEVMDTDAFVDNGLDGQLCGLLIIIIQSQDLGSQGHSAESQIIRVQKDSVKNGDWNFQDDDHANGQVKISG